MVLLFGVTSVVAPGRARFDAAADAAGAGWGLFISRHCGQTRRTRGAGPESARSFRRRRFVAHHGASLLLRRRGRGWRLAGSCSLLWLAQSTRWLRYRPLAWHAERVALVRHGFALYLQLRTGAGLLERKSSLRMVTVAFVAAGLYLIARKNPWNRARRISNLPAYGHSAAATALLGLAGLYEAPRWMARVRVGRVCPAAGDGGLALPTSTSFAGRCTPWQR